MITAECDNPTVDKILEALAPGDTLQCLYKTYLEPIIEYDKYCGTDYLDFIFSYLQYDGHIKTISEKMFLHRNTVHYRIKKIEELLGCDLSKLDTKMYLLLAASAYAHAKEAQQA